MFQECFAVRYSRYALLGWFHLPAMGRLCLSSEPGQKNAIDCAEHSHGLIKHVVMVGARDMVDRGFTLSNLLGEADTSRIVISAVFAQKESDRTANSLQLVQIGRAHV